MFVYVRMSDPLKRAGIISADALRANTDKKAFKNPWSEFSPHEPACLHILGEALISKCFKLDLNEKREIKHRKVNESLKRKNLRAQVTKCPM